MSRTKEEASNRIPASHRKGLLFKIAITWLFIFFLVGFLIATRSSASPVTMSVIPEVPKAGEPVVASFNLNNATDEPVTTQYSLFVNGTVVQSGSATVLPQESTKYVYSYRNLKERGEQISFVLRTASDLGSFERNISVPAFPPQLMSSFVSFAAFSTSVMSSMISAEYFNATFGIAKAINTGVVISITLIALLIFLELTPAVKTEGQSTILGRYRVSFRGISTILFIIFIGMVFTRVVMILAT